MLPLIRRYVIQTNLYVLKRSFSFSVTWNSNSNEQTEKYIQEFNNELQNKKKLLKVALIGLPNAGKSTLINQLMSRSLCPTSSKVHTTMHKAEAICTEGDAQIIFMDTPGLVTSEELKKYKLEKTFKDDPKNSITEADVIGIIHDVKNIYTRHMFHIHLLKILQNRREDAELLLILNKVDMIKNKSVLLQIIRTLQSKPNYPKFNDIFMISALEGDGVQDLKNYLFDSVKVTDWKYEENTYIDQSITTITQQTVRAKLMDILPKEIPYRIKIEIDHYDLGEGGNISFFVSLICNKKSYTSMLLTKNAFKVKLLSHDVEKELRYAFRCSVCVRINVVFKKQDSLNK